MKTGGPASGRIGGARLGIFGGTFDPPHVGHLIVARDAAESLELDRLLLVVAAQSPTKLGTPGTPGPVRLRMVEAAVQDDPVLEASDLEVRRGGTSWTIDTLQELRARHADAELFLLIGVDQWRDFSAWKDPQGIAALATVAVMARDGQEPLRADPGLTVPCRRVPVRRIDLSSTEVRERVQAGRTIRDLVPERVRTIIERDGLYRAHPLRSAQHA